jgi:hypothetical protein
LPIAAMFALGAFMLFTGTGAGRISRVEASEPQLTIGVDTDPEDGVGYTFDLDVDGNNASGNDCEDDFDNTSVTLDDDESETVIECDDDDASIDVTVSIEVPSHSELTSISCSVDDEGLTAGDDSVIQTPDVDEDQGSVEMTIEDEEHVVCDFDFDFDASKLATATPEVGPPATIEVSSSNNNLGCGATSIITIVVSDEDGEPVEEGTLVNIVADKGSVSPASGQLTADSSLFVFYTAPTNQGGEATITAASGSAVGETTVDIDCNNEPTQAPPPTTAPSGGIQPPNTGDGGLSSSNSWQPYAGIAIILSSVIATLVVVRPRRS